MFRKKCEICGKQFDGKVPNAKYCSDACRDRGAALRREEWEERTGYRKKKREEMQQRRREAEERFRRPSKSREEVHAEYMADLYSRAEAGDHYAKREIARMNGDRIGFWTAYRDEEIAWSASFGKKSRRIVNGISVYDPDFVESVIRSIDEGGQCIQSLEPDREGYM